MDDELARRRQLFAPYLCRVAPAGGKTKRRLVRYTCPCCGYPTLSQRGMYEICILCNWEDDDQDDPRADEVLGGPNDRYSLVEARENFKRYWIMYDPDDKRSNDSPLELQAKRAMAAAFDAMPQADAAQQRLLWDTIRAQEQTLKHELDRKVREHERELKERRSGGADAEV